MRVNTCEPLDKSVWMRYKSHPPFSAAAGVEENHKDLDAKLLAWMESATLGVNIGLKASEINVVTSPKPKILWRALSTNYRLS